MPVFMIYIRNVFLNQYKFNTFLLNYVDTINISNPENTLVLFIFELNLLRMEISLLN